MPTPAHIYREYDIRGVVETDLTPDVVSDLGRGLGTAFRRAGLSKVAISRDVRESGLSLFRSLSEGFLSTGCDVVDLGQLPTPAAYHAVAVGDEEGGVQITGSHNPPEFNGFKITMGGGSFFGKDIQQVRRWIDAQDFETGQGTLTARDAMQPYLDDLVKSVNLARKPRFAYDCGNGAGALMAADLFARLGLEPVALFDEPDGTFPNHHPDPSVPANLEDLQRAVVEQGLELGVAYDGDADRIGVIDEKGRVIWGDRLLILYARDLLSRQPGSPVIFDVKCSQTLADAITAAGGKPVIWKTGHSLIKAKMKETGAKLAGEMSGHMFFGETWYGFDDAIYATLKLLEIVARGNTPVSGLLADVPELQATPEIRIDCPDDQKFEVVRKVTDAFRANHDIVDIDGARVRFEHGWGLVRASNTQPALVMRVEASSVEHMNDYRGQLERAIAQAGA